MNLKPWTWSGFFIGSKREMSLNYNMISEVDLYLEEGCGRCSHHQTPECKVHNWPEELRELRRIVLECELTEEYKWSQPTYTLKGHNVLIVTAFKHYACISFFKGSLLEDTHSMLISPGRSSQAARQLRFTDPKTILENEHKIKSYIYQAIEVEKAGLKVEFRKNPEPMPEELEKVMEDDPVFAAAFESLTPGRQRGYILHFSQPKQSATRLSRIEKCTPKILNGEGMHDAYKRQNK